MDITKLTRPARKVLKLKRCGAVIVAAGNASRMEQNRKLAFIENGTWAPVAARIMKTMFEKSKNLTFAETIVTLRSALNEQSRAQVEQLGEELCRE